MKAYFTLHSNASAQYDVYCAQFLRRTLTIRIQWLTCSCLTGTAAILHGYFDTSQAAFPSSVSYSVSLDGVPTTNYVSSFTPDPNSEDNVLAAFTNLTNQEHSIELALHAAGDAVVDGSNILLRFDRAVLQSEPPSSAPKQ